MKDNFIFICHSSKDKKTARALYDYLQGRGLHCWIDQRSLQPGASYLEGIMEAIYASAMMIVIISKHTGESVYIPNEVERAFKLRKPILPVRTDDAELNKSLELALASTHYLDASGGRVEQYFDAVYEGCVRLMGVEREEVTERNVKPIPKWRRKVQLVLGIGTATSIITVWAVLGSANGKDAMPRRSENSSSTKPDTVKLISPDSVKVHLPVDSNKAPTQQKKGVNTQVVSPTTTQTNTLLNTLSGSRFSRNGYASDGVTLSRVSSNTLSFTINLGKLYASGKMRVLDNTLKIISGNATGYLQIHDNGNRLTGNITFTEFDNQTEYINFTKQ
jgi:TIR domain